MIKGSTVEIECEHEVLLVLVLAEHDQSPVDIEVFDDRRFLSFVLILHQHVVLLGVSFVCK